MFALIGLDQAHQVSDGVVNVIKYVAPRFAIRAVVLIKFQGRRRLHMRCGATIDISASNVDSGKSRISCLRSIPRLISAKMPVEVATPGTVNGKTSNRRMILKYVEQFARYLRFQTLHRKFLTLPNNVAASSSNLIIERQRLRLFSIPFVVSRLSDTSFTRTDINVAASLTPGTEQL